MLIMKKTRIAYNWKFDGAYTFFWSFVFLTIFLLTFELLAESKRPSHELLIAFYGFALPIITLFIGLRPILSLFTLPDTLFVNDTGLLITSESEIITVENISTLEINQVGAGSGYLIYYEMTFIKLPTILKNKKRKSLILIEPYNIKYIFQSRTDFIDKLIEIGLEENKIKNKPYKTKNFFGIRDNFKK